MGPNLAAHWQGQENKSTEWLEKRSQQMASQGSACWQYHVLFLDLMQHGPQQCATQPCWPPHVHILYRVQGAHLTVLCGPWFTLPTGLLPHPFIIYLYF